MITADSVTNKQLRELREWAQRVVLDVGHALLLGKPGEIKTPTLLKGVMECRARCAEVINMRGGK